MSSACSVAGRRFAFAAGETIHTENSYKYTPESFVALAREAGFSAHRLWTDPARWFGVFFLHNCRTGMRCWALRGHDRRQFFDVRSSGTARR